MSATLSNSINKSNNIVTRLRKRRDLETTMTTLKKLLEPSITLTNKKGTRKKNKPRTIAKKVLALTKINRFEDNSEDGEYYPNKLKRKDNIKKILLKPKHKLKVVVATNKRKRGTPHKGLESLEEESALKELSGLKDKPIADFKKHRSTDLKVHTPPPSINPVDKYKLISPPHKSLTELTIEDLIRMDEDSLSDEDLMEVLTCPSPVWWENPPDDFEDGALYLFKTTDNSPTVITNGEKHTTEENIPSISNLINVGTRLKRTGTVSDIRSKAKKIAKLENILGNIKSRVQSDNKLANNNDVGLKDKSLEANDDANLASDDNNDGNDQVDEMHEDIKENSDGTDTKHRTVSSSCSDISVNEDDLLRNLESIDIPVQNTDTIENIKNHVNANDFYAENDIPRDYVDDVNLKCEEKLQDSPEQSKVDETVNVTNKQIKPETVKMLKFKNKNDLDSSKQAAELNRGKKPESKHKDILKRLKTSDDILDVRLIQTPTNITNEVKIWSKLDNFKRHNFKPEDFDDKVIDVEDELDFHMIQSVLNSPSQERDPLDPKNCTILIDDDSNDGFDERTKSTMKDIIDLDVIEKSNVTIDTEFENDVSHTDINASKDIIKEDTIRIGNVLDIRLIETEGILQNVLPKPKSKRSNAVSPGTALKDPLESQSQLNNSINKSKDIEIQEITVLPKESIETISQTISTTNQTYLNDSNTVRNMKNKNSKYIEQSIDDYSNQNTETSKIIDTDDNNMVLRISDVDISHVQNTGSNKDIRMNEILNPEIYIKNTDLSITLLSKKDDVKGVAIVPIILPSLTKNPKSIFESPKSIKSIMSECATEYSEGTISDTNIQFLDEYEDKRTEKYIDIKPDFNEIEDYNRLSKDQDDENKSIAELSGTNKSRINILDKKRKVFDNNSENIEKNVNVAFFGENSKTGYNKRIIEELDEDNRDIEEEYLDEVGDNEDEEAIKNILADTYQNEVNNRNTEDFDVDNKSIEEEYLDEDGNNEIEEVHISILNKNRHDSSHKNVGNGSRTEDFDDNSKSIEEEYLDEDSDGKSLGEEDANKYVLYNENKSRQDDLDQNEGSSIAEEDNKGCEEEYLDDEEDNEEADKSIMNKSRSSRKTEFLEDDSKGCEEEYLDDVEDNEEADKSIKNKSRNRSSEAKVLKDDRRIEEEYSDDEEEENKEEKADKIIFDQKNSRTRDEVGNKSIDEEYLDEDSNSIGEEDPSKSIQEVFNKA